MGTDSQTRADGAPINLYAAISVDDVRLFLAQNEIRSLEPAVDLNPDEPPAQGVGWIAFVGRDWPVYCLSGDLDPSRRLPAARRICILLGVDQSYFGLMCDRLDVLSADRLQPVPLPPVMHSPHTPVQALALHEGTPGCVISADSLLGYLEFCAGSGSAQDQAGRSC